MIGYSTRIKNVKGRSAANKIAGKTGADNLQHKKPAFEHIHSTLTELADQSMQVGQTAQLKALADQHVSEQTRSTNEFNLTGMPDQLKTGVENLSGLSMDDVKVHYNSDKPAQLNAHAFAKGSEIHLGPGQETHLPHEAWHVVQQKQGRVKPTFSLDGHAINDEKTLESEADEMGQKAMSTNLAAGSLQSKESTDPTHQLQVIQRDEYGPDDIKIELQGKKDDYQLGGVSNLAIGRFVDDWFEEAYESDRRLNPNMATTASTVATAYRSSVTSGGGGFHVPRSTYVYHMVGGTQYCFYNDANGFLDFTTGQYGKPACPNAGGIWDVNIHDGTGKLKHTGQPLASGNRGQHFKVANIIREGGKNPPNEGSSSPAGWTWHHHADKGRMQLINREVHAAFAHRGGMAVWGN